MTLVKVEIGYNDYRRIEPFGYTLQSLILEFLELFSFSEIPERLHQCQDLTNLSDWILWASSNRLEAANFKRSVAT